MKANLQALGLAFVAFENHWPPSLEGFDEVFLFGGDGTLNYFINHYGVPDQVVLTLFPGGTGNDLHWKLFDQTQRRNANAKLAAISNNIHRCGKMQQ